MPSVDAAVAFRIQRSIADDIVVLKLSGDIAADREAELQTILDADAGRTLVVDLRDVGMVDRSGVQLLARSELRGATMTNCPAYVRNWIQLERDGQGIVPGRKDQ